MAVINGKDRIFLDATGMEEALAYVRDHYKFESLYVEDVGKPDPDFNGE